MIKWEKGISINYQTIHQRRAPKGALRELPPNYRHHGRRDHHGRHPAGRDGPPPRRRTRRRTGRGAGSFPAPRSGLTEGPAGPGRAYEGRGREHEGRRGHEGRLGQAGPAGAT